MFLFHTSIDTSNLCGIRHPDFARHKRKKLKYEHVASSPMHDLALGIYKSLMHLFFEFANKLGVSKFLKDNISTNLFELCNSNIDFYQ